MKLPEKKVKRLIALMNTMSGTEIPPTKPIIRCFEIGMDEDILNYLLRVGTAPHSKETLEELFHTMVAMGELTKNRTWKAMWAEIMEMSFLLPCTDTDDYELAPIFPGWIEISTSGPTNEKRLAILKNFLEFWETLRKLNVGPMRAYTNRVGLKKRATNAPTTMSTLTALTPGKKAKRSVAVDQKLMSQQQVLSKGTVFDVLNRHKNSIAVMNCFCRHYKHKAQDEVCDYDIPLESCMPVGKVAEQLIEAGTARRVSFEEAVELLEELERKGCIHTTFHVGNNSANETMAICNCCTDCCLLYGSYQKAYTSKIYIQSFNSPELVDEEACIGCNKCGKVCPSDAMRFDRHGDKLVFNYENCVGCGQCVTQCPTNVHRMVADERTVFVKTKKRSEARA